MKLNRISYALIVALAGTVALAGCKKKEEAVVAPAPVIAEPAPTPAPVEAAPVSTTSIVVGNTVAADKSVAAVSSFSAKDKIVVSVKTDATTPANATIDAKLTFQDGQVAGQKSGSVLASDAGTSNIEFTNSNPWPVGKYTVVVTLNGQPVGLAQDIEVK